MANITYPDKIVGSQYLNTEANQVKEVVNTNAARLTTVEGVAPTANQKAALAGTHGSPSGSNRYVTDGDPRLGGLSLPKAIFLPVEDVDALRAIDTTDATQYPNNWLIFVKTLGVYYLDRAATGSDDGNLVIEPAGGVGRWIKETRTSTGDGGGPAIADVYADTTALLAAQGDQEAQAVYRVDDASGFGLTGYAYYEYLGTTVGDDTDYKLVGAEEFLVPGGDVSGPATSTDNAIVLFDGTTGKLVKDSTVTVGSLASVTETLASNTPSTSGGTITLDFENRKQLIAVGSASFSGSKTIALSNNTNALVLNFHFQLSASGTLTFPSSFKMDTSESRWNVDTYVLTLTGEGYYEVSATYDGTRWKLKASSNGGYI